MQLQLFNNNIIKASDSKKEEATKQVYFVACKDRNELFIDVVLQEARLLRLTIKLLIKKKKKRNKKIIN